MEPCCAGAVSPRSAPVFRNEVSEPVALLRRSALFGSLSQTALAHLAQTSRFRQYGRGEVLFLQGQTARCLSLVHTGCVKLSVTNPGGAEVIVGLRGPAQAVELNVDRASGVHGVSAEAVRPCRVLIWNQAFIEDLMERTPELSGNIRGILSRQLAELQERFSELSSDKVEFRVASMLARVAEQFGRPVKAGLEIAFSREELAQMTGTTLFTVSRLLSKWKGSGLLVPRREAVAIVSLQHFREVTSRDGSLAPPRPLRRSPLSGTGLSGMPLPATTSVPHPHFAM